MESEKIKEILNYSPSIRLLRAKHAHFMLSFFSDVFKREHQLAIKEEILINRLIDYLKQEEIELQEDDEEYRIEFFDNSDEKAKKLIRKWAEQDFLRNYYDEKGCIIFELTTHTDKVLEWLFTLEKKDFIGTESRFKDIVHKLKDIVEFSTEDKARRLEELETRKAQIEDEIRRVQIAEKVDVYDNYQIKSRLDEFIESAKKLLSEFKEVEENFKAITRRIYQKHADSTLTKGNILAFAFDAIDDLKESEQGKSFYSFWEFLIAPSKQDEWKSLTNQLIRILEEREISFDYHFLRQLKTFLYKNGQKVYDANDLMAEKLSRIISEQEKYERIRVKQVIGVITENALKIAEKNVIPPCEFTIEVHPEINLFMERRIQIEKPEISEFSAQPEKKNIELSELTDFSKLLHQEYVDRKRLEKNIQCVLESFPQVSLKHVVSMFPIEKGLAEVVCYFTIAKDHPDKCVIASDTCEDILFDEQQGKYLRLPQVIYAR